MISNKKIKQIIQKTTFFFQDVSHRDVPSFTSFEEPLTDKKNELEVVDNYIITSTVAFIGVFINIILTNRFQLNTPWIYFKFISISCFTLSLLLMLWHKQRYIKKKNLFNDFYKNWKKRVLVKIERLFNLYGELTSLRIKNYLYEHEVEIGNLTEEEIADKIKKEVILNLPPSKEFDYIIESLSSFVHEDLRQKYLSIYQQPMTEEKSRIKYWLDVSSIKLRYVLFVGGLLSFLLLAFLDLS